MESIFRAIFIYIFLMFIIRISGTRTLSEMTTFDLVLLLIIGDASQQAIIGNDNSITNAVIVITTFILMDVGMAFLKYKYIKFDNFLDGTPLILVNDGKLITKMMQRAKINKFDILEAARKTHGLSSLQQVKYAVLEKNGEITIIPAT